MIHIRRDIWCLESVTTFEPTTLAYAQAVADMQSRPTNDPTSWTFQAGMHGSYSAPPPGAAWNQCQHASWFFLSWHRMYLYWFERIVRASVIKLLGHSHKHWALPYWNYSKGFPSNTLPPAFRQPNLPGGAPNALYVPDPGRNTFPAPGINGGAQVPPSATDFSGAFAYTNFTPPPPPGFGGGKHAPIHFGTATGALESVPHNVIHGLVGGSGLMGDPNRAAQDPIFWLHHANIDRLWSHWLESGGGRTDPSDPTWLTPSFTFYDETGATVTMTSQDVLDTVHQLEYRYEDEPPPVVYPPKPPHVRPHLVHVPEPEILAVSEEPIELAGPAKATLRVDEARWDVFSEFSAETAQKQTIDLWVEGIEFTENPGVIYELFMNLPREADEEARFTHLVGFVTFFGGSQHQGHMPDNHDMPGMTEVFNLTNLILRLKETPQFRERTLEFSFEPLGLLPPPQAEGVASRERVEPLAPATIRRLRVTSSSIEAGS
jgi:hypothetical protein